MENLTIEQINSKIELLNRNAQGVADELQSLHKQLAEVKNNELAELHKKAINIQGTYFARCNEGTDKDNPLGRYYTQDDIDANLEYKNGIWCPFGQKEIKLLAECKSKWIEEHGVYGRLFENELFLPAAGLRRYGDGLLSYVGEIGFYWSTWMYIIGSNQRTYELYFDRCTASHSSNDRTYRFSVRCVLK